MKHAATATMDAKFGFVFPHREPHSPFGYRTRRPRPGCYRNRLGTA
ncbi:hypothetical protein ABID21_001965 [Pseudorhizobium tarimense]|uniref:Uncharacterized protein n=1 Tax=Pseudorhizobium tarimense TaxID=1079109 RepID=A0ABV2H5U1_9HYPH